MLLNLDYTTPSIESNGGGDGPLLCIARETYGVKLLSVDIWRNSCTITSPGKAGLQNSGSQGPHLEE